MSSRAYARRALWAALIVAAGIAAYGPYLDGPFLFDDLHTIRDNPAVRELSLRRFFLDPGTASTRVATMVRPLLTLSYALDFRRAGLDPQDPRLPRVFRQTNLLLHILNALLVALLLRRTRLRPLAVEAGLLFLLLPLSAINVAYLSNRSVLLSGLCYLAGLNLFAAAHEGRLSRLPALTGLAALYALGLLSKDNAATLPVAVLLWGLLLPGRDRRLAGQAAAALAAVLAVYLAYRHALAAPTFFPAARPWPVGSYLAAQVPVTVRYALWMLWPVGLALEHDAWMPAGPAGLLHAGLWAAAAALAAGLGLAWRVRKTAPELSFAAFFFVLFLLPTNSVIPLTMVANENRPYLSALLVAVGLPALAAWVLGRKEKSRGRKALPTGDAGGSKDPPIRDRKAPLTRGLTPARVWLALVAAMFLLLTRGRAGEFATPVAAWEAAVRAAPRSFRAWQNLGQARAEYGRDREARAAWLRATGLSPCADGALNSLGNLEYRAGRAAEAERLYLAAHSCDADSSATFNLVDLYLEGGRGREAAALIAEALARRASDPRALGRQGELLAAQGDRAGAARFLRQAYEVEPGPERRRWAAGLRGLGQEP